MSKRKERSEVIHGLQDVEECGLYSFEKKRNILGVDPGCRSLLGIKNGESEKENTKSLDESSSTASLGYILPQSEIMAERDSKNIKFEPSRDNYLQLLTKYENLQTSHSTLQKVVRSLLDKINHMNDLYAQKEKELNECKAQLKKVVDANETLNLYIQSSHSSVMNSSIINKFGSDIY
ncbi:hypothetical protein FG386_003497 [Cryptosporidium ryanae]|uniref:uncharacterized protein n=1 Tax=Cryptosporidium ryanae TaxID=515981 RepID=UPI00351A15F2|nr:hypothetical protein FG386_003497 [Cryptosporidium ryanae]